MNPYKHGCVSKTIYVYHMSNNIVFNIMNIENQDMLKAKTCLNYHYKACKLKLELEIVTNHTNYSLSLQTMVVLLPKHSLDLIQPWYDFWVRNASPSRYQYSHVLWEPTPTSNTIGVNFGTHILLGPWGFSTFPNPNKLICKI